MSEQAYRAEKARDIRAIEEAVEIFVAELLEQNRDAQCVAARMMCAAVQIMSEVAGSSAAIELLEAHLAEQMRSYH